MTVLDLNKSSLPRVFVGSHMTSFRGFVLLTHKPRREENPQILYTSQPFTSNHLPRVQSPLGCCMKVHEALSSLSPADSEESLKQRMTMASFRRMCQNIEINILHFPNFHPNLKEGLRRDSNTFYLIETFTKVSFQNLFFFYKK